MDLCEIPTDKNAAIGIFVDTGILPIIRVYFFLLYTMWLHHSPGNRTQPIVRCGKGAPNLNGNPENKGNHGNENRKRFIRPVSEITSGEIIPIITFSHHKGGTGKTTSCLNIAGFCVLAGKRVLVVDCDPQANATTGLGFDPDLAGRNMYDVFMSRVGGFPRVGIRDVIRKTSSGIDLAPSHLDLVGVEPYLYPLADRAKILKEAIDEVRGSYDLILIDTPPSMGQFVINCLYAADYIVITLDSGSFALSGVSTLSTIFADMNEDLGKEISPKMAIVTRWGEGGGPECPAEPEKKDIFLLLRGLFYKTPGPTQEEVETHRERERDQAREQERSSRFMGEISKKFPRVFTVPYSTGIYAAQQRGLPISHFAPESRAGQAYKTISDEVMRWS